MLKDRIFKDRRIQKAISSYEISKGWSTVFLFYGLLVAGMLGQLLFLGMRSMGVESAEGYAWFLGVLCFAVACYYIVNYPVIGLILGAFMTLQVAGTAAYFTYHASGLGMSLAVSTGMSLASYAIHFNALEDLKNT